MQKRCQTLAYAISHFKPGLKTKKNISMYFLFVGGKLISVRKNSISSLETWISIYLVWRFWNNLNAKLRQNKPEFLKNSSSSITSPDSSAWVSCETKLWANVTRKQHHLASWIIFSQKGHLSNEKAYPAKETSRVFNAFVRSAKCADWSFWYGFHTIV